MKRAVIVGGFTTGKRAMEPLGNSLCQQFEFYDVDIFTLPEALRDPGYLQLAAYKQHVLALSAGPLAVKRHMSPEHIAAFNSPEPTTIADLAGRAAIKSLRLYKQIVIGDDRRGAARVAVTNAAETMKHPLAHGRMLQAVSRFSTTAYLDAMRADGVRTAIVDTAGDEFFGPHRLQPWDGQTIVLPGVHDQILINPDAFLAQLPAAAIGVARRS